MIINLESVNSCKKGTIADMVFVNKLFVLFSPLFPTSYIESACGG